MEWIATELTGSFFLIYGEIKLTVKHNIGSSVNLSKRLRNYFNESYLISLKDFMVIYKALLVYGYENFTLARA